MSDLTKEQFEALPDYAKEAFTADGDKYVPAKDAKLKSTLDELDGKYKSADQKAKELEERLSGYEQQKKADIEKAREEALEQARSKGDVKEIEQRYQQQLEDLQKRSEESETKYKETVSNLTSTLKTREKGLLAAKLASDLATDDGRDLFADVVQSRIDVDASTGKPIFLNADGSASALDLDGFKKELESDSRLKPLLRSKAVTTGGGLANGSNGKGSASTVKGNLGGNRDERKAAIAERFNLNE